MWNYYGYIKGRGIYTYMPANIQISNIIIEVI